jgi:putative ABC transport system permease protein
VLARGVGRRRELAIRAALGATRRRIARQLLTESFVLAIAGGVAGSVLASWMARAVRSLGGPLLPRLGEVTVDARALGFALLACIAAAALFGTLPALHASRQGDAESLKYRGSAARTGRLQSAMVVMELALSVVLLSAAALLGAAFVRLIQTDPGFRPAQVVTTHLTLPRVRYATRAQRTAFLDRVLDRRHAGGVVCRRHRRRAARG